MATEIARRAQLALFYKGVNLNKYATHVVYTDHAQGQLDELDVRLEDREGLWLGSYFPEKGDHLEAFIICLDWDWPGQRTMLRCGEFRIDEVTLQGPPDTVSIKAFSAKTDKNSRTERKVHKWEPAVLHTIAEEIAGRAGLKLVWRGHDTEWVRKEQREEGDLNFLRRLCQSAGNLVKVIDDELRVYAQSELEGTPATQKLILGQSWIKTYHFRTHTHDVYKGAEVKYWDYKKQELYTHVHLAKKSPKSAEMLQVKQRVESLKDAIALAQSSLRSKNRAEVEADFCLVGDTTLRATTVVKLEGFGRFNGDYFVEEARHTLDSKGGYSTDLSLLKRYED